MEPAKPEVVAPRSARDLLVVWANRQDHWVRAIVGEALLSRRELSPAAVAHVTELFLVEKQLADGDTVDVPVLGSQDTEPPADQSLSLVSLRECRGVNALAEGQTIEFNPKMTVLFGENAAGKTGYVRVLKRVASVRSAEEIIPDIHRATPAPTPQAVLRYTVDGGEQDLPWEGEAGVPPLTRLSVFDAPAVALHVDDDLTYVYTPPDLALFRYVHGAIDAVRSDLETKRSENEPRQNPFLTAFTRDAVIYPKIEQLGPTSDLADLETLATLSDAERAEIDALKTSVEALASQSIRGSSETVRNRIAVLAALRDLIVACEQFSSQALSTAVSRLADARTVQASAATAVLGGEVVSSEVRSAWQAFVEAGEEYLRTSDMESYPKPDEACVYCKQPLDASALALLQSYREYATGAAAAALEEATEAVRLAEEPLRAGTVAKALFALNAFLPSIEDAEEPPDWATDARILVRAVEAARTAFPSTDAAETPTVQMPATLRTRVTSALTEADTTLQAVEGDARGRETLLAEQRTRLATLEARLTLARLIPEIRIFVENAQWASRLKLLLGRFQGLLKSLTEVSKTASAELLNEGFRQAFYKECQALRAPNVGARVPRASRSGSTAQERDERPFPIRGALGGRAKGHRRCRLPR